MNSSDQSISGGLWAGRYQAFALMASKCNLARAECLQHMREERVFQELGLSWDEFCKRYAGISRPNADRLIHQLQEFGEDYFRLSEIVAISDAAYRQIAPRIEGDTIDLGGEPIAIIPENAAKIRAGIRTLRDEIGNLQRDVLFVRGQATELHHRLNGLVDEFRRRAEFPFPEDERSHLASILRYAISQLHRVEKEFDRPAKLQPGL
jgi:hypothetical protein